MSDRTVSVKLEALVAGFKAQMAQAQAATKQFAGDFGRNLDTMSKKSVQFEDAYRKAMDTRHTRAMDVAGVALVATLGLAVVKAASFEKSLSNVKAVTNATTGEMTALRQAALEAGQATVFSASQAADAIGELAKAGVSTRDILGGGLRGALDLAAAGGLDLAEAATIASQSMNTFNLSGRDVAHIADVLAAGANKSAADVESLAMAMRQGGLVAKQTGLSFEDTAGVLSLFADNALVGSDAGTSLKTMLQRLTPQSKEAQRMFDQLGISAYDAQGQFVGLDNFAGQLHDRLGELTPQARNAALSVMFGSDAVRAAAVLYDAGAKGVQEYVAAVNDQGAAQRMAATMTDNLAGDIERLQGAIETGLIKGGTGANNVLRAMAQRAETAVDAYSKLPEPVIATGLAVAGLSGGFLLLAPRIMAAVEAAKAMNLSWGKFGKGLLGGAAVTAVLAVGTSALSAKSDFDELIAEVERLDKALTLPGAQRTQALSEIVAQYAEAGREARKQFDQGWDFSSIGSAWTSTTQAVSDAFSGDSWNPFQNAGAKNDARLAGIADMQKQLADFNRIVMLTQANLGQTKEQATETVDAAYAAGVEFTDDYATSAEAVNRWATATNAGHASVQAAMAATANAALSMTDVLLGAQDLLDKRGQRRSYFESIKAATDALKKNGQTLDITTRKGRDNQAALDGIARSTLALATAKDKEGNVTVTNAKAMERGRNAYIQSAIAMGMNRKAAERLADKVLGTSDTLAELRAELDKIPTKKETRISVDTSQAMRAIMGVRTALGNLQSSRVTIDGKWVNRGQAATGGQITGPGTGTSDSIPAWLSNGEYVVRASAVQQYGTAFLDAVNAQRFASGGQVRQSAAERVQARFNGRGQAYLEYASGIRSDLRSFGALSGSYDEGAATDALREQTDAAQALANAQDRLNKIRAYAATATDPKARAQALALEADAKDALAVATGRLAAADQQVAATRPNSTNFLQAQAAKNKTARQYLADMKKLASMGLSRSALGTIWSKGPEEGALIARALVEGGASAVGTANAQQRESNQLARRAGEFAASNRYGITSAEARGMAGMSITFAKGAVQIGIEGEVGAATERRLERVAERAVKRAIDRSRREARHS